jgi:hypothetical protein
MLSKRTTGKVAEASAAGNSLLNEGFPSQQTLRLPILADAVDTWYAYHYPNLCDLFEPLLHRTFPSWTTWFASRFSFVRGCLFFLMARKYSLVLTTTVSSAAKTYLFLEALFGIPRKNLIFIEFIQQGKPDSRSILRSPEGTLRLYSLAEASQAGPVAGSQVGGVGTLRGELWQGSL